MAAPGSGTGPAAGQAGVLRAALCSGWGGGKHVVPSRVVASSACCWEAASAERCRLPVRALPELSQAGRAPAGRRTAMPCHPGRLSSVLVP